MLSELSPQNLHFETGESEIEMWKPTHVFRIRLVLGRQVLNDLKGIFI